MNITDTGRTAFSVITNAQDKANQAAHDIATFPIDKQEIGKPAEFDSSSVLAPLISLHEASAQTQAGVKLLQADSETKQSVLDIFV